MNAALPASRTAGQLAWLAALAAGGFAVPAVASAWLRLPRDALVLVNALAVSALAWAYLRWDATPVRVALRRYWAWGLAGAVLFGALASAGALRGVAASAAQGLAAVWAVLWLGGVYGVVDALLLNVLPVWIAWRLLRAEGADASWGRLLGAGALALLASLAVTAAYHLGYVEFRSAALFAPLFGNAILTLAYLLTRSPLAPLGAHAILHVSTVLLALDTAVTLPPHY
jgi:hypothetical protein